MNCNQCEQTFRGTACVTSPGVCGKDDDVQSLQELILYGLKGMAAAAAMGLSRGATISRTMPRRPRRTASS